MAETVISTVARKVGSLAVSGIVYVFSFKSYIDDFNDLLLKLKLKRERIEHSVEEAIKNKLELIERDVEYWLQRVRKMEENVESFLQEAERAENGCFYGLCPNVKERYRLSKKAKEESKTIADLLIEGHQFTSVSYRPTPQGIRFTPIKDYGVFESRTHCLEEIMKALKDPNVNMIGVWGMGGVGKTTLVKKAAEQANLDRAFDVVVLSEISLDPNIGKIQGEIADALKFKFEANTICGRANELFERLKEEKRILVIIDNIWEGLDLREVGISFDDDHKGCKILLTSRDERVLTEGMGTNYNIKVDTLADEEAWGLFEMMAGEIVKFHKILAIQIAKRCAGLPILLVTVARALRCREESSSWKDALEKLKRVENHRLVAQTYAALKLSYDYLRSGEEIKKLFRICGLLVNVDFAIEDLLDYCLSLRAFQNNQNLEGQKNKLQELVRELKASCFLLDSDKDGYIKMHDVVRYFALSIAMQKHSMFRIAYDGELKEWPNKNTIKTSTAICNCIQELPERLKCPNLELFILHPKNRNLKIPCSFFQGMSGLIVLVIKNMIIPSLPSSISSLKNICTLSLEDCELEDIAIIGNLKRLEVLRIVNAGISSLPKEIRQLTRLKLLNVNRCHGLELVPPNIISSLTHLEELSMEDGFRNWEIEGNACLTELKILFKLTSLNIHIRNFQIVPEDLFSKKLERYKILVGDDWKWHSYRSNNFEASRMLKLKQNSTCFHLEHSIKALLRGTEDLHLDELMEVNNVFELEKEGFMELRNLNVQKSSSIQYIVNSTNGAPCHVFPCLELLSLSLLSNLKMICYGQLATESFSNLRIVKVKSCDMLKNLFSFSVIKVLSQLQKIEVSECKNMEEVFAIESEKDDNIELSQLHSLNLKSLPLLTSICSEKLPTMDKPNAMMSLFTTKIVLPSLELLTLEEIFAEKIWDDRLLAMPRLFQTLTKLTVEKCNFMKSLFSVSIVTSLVQIKWLSIKGCELMDVIIEGVENNVIFPRLEFMFFSNLPELTRFCTCSSLGFPSLLEMRICSCPKLRSFVLEPTSIDKEVSNNEILPLFDDKVDLPSIEKLRIRNNKQLKQIWHNELAEDSFCKLNNIWVNECENLLNIFPSNMLTRLQSLQKMRIWSCKSVDGIFVPEMHVGKTIKLKKLTWINIDGCPSLKYVFPPSVAKGLAQLESLNIQSCEALENIVSIEEGVNTDIMFAFPKVTVLYLKDLQELRSFYPGIHTSKWPELKILRVIECDKLKIFASESSNFQEESDDMDVQQPLFLLEKDKYPNLEHLSLSWNATMQEMWHGIRVTEFLCSIRSLKVEDSCHDETASFPPQGFFENVPNLEKLDVTFCVFKDIFPREEVVGKTGVVSTVCTLKVLRLRLYHGGRMLNLFPASLSFCNLTEVEINRCLGWTYLMPSSTAKSMVQLTKLKVDRCEMMMSIVECASRDGEPEDYYIFSQLKEIYIYHMSKLSSFCNSTELAFKFPSLEEVNVRNCPYMKSFCEGPLYTSNLKSLLLDGGKRWNGNLNTAIQSLFNEKMAARTIRRHVRKYIARRNFIALRKASIVIQSATRGTIARKNFESLTVEPTLR